MIPIPHRHIRAAVKAALQEDLPSDDITTAALFPTPLSARATILAKEPLTIAGLAVAKQVFLLVDPTLRFQTTRQEGETVSKKSVLLTMTGDARSLLKGERVALNFLQHLSGIATLTRKCCQAVYEYPTKILDTRKTIPGLRALQKWAVRLGGGTNHRFSLSDGLLIKDNHLILLKSQGATTTKACQLARKNGPHLLRVCVEAPSLAHVREALKGHPDVILLDNMTPALVQKAVHVIKGRALVEVSGGITLATVQHMAAAGADFISIGALTHSAPAMDISMDLVSLHTSRRNRSNKARHG